MPERETGPVAIVEPHHPTPPPIATDRVVLEHLRLRFEEHAETDRRELAAIRDDIKTVTKKQTGVIALITTVLTAIGAIVHAFLG